MASSPIVTGARSKLAAYDPVTGLSKTLGIFSNVSWGGNYSVEEAYILGAYAPGALTITSQNPVNITASAYRVIDHSVHVDGQLPRLQDLLNFQYLTMTVIDRQLEATGAADARTAVFVDVVPNGYTTTINARNQQELSMTFTARLMPGDESGLNFEDPSAAVLPG